MTTCFRLEAWHCYIDSAMADPEAIPTSSSLIRYITIFSRDGR